MSVLTVKSDVKKGEEIQCEMQIADLCRLRMSFMVSINLICVEVYCVCVTSELLFPGRPDSFGISSRCLKENLEDVNSTALIVFE